jgi:hypothetical protein
LAKKLTREQAFLSGQEIKKFLPVLRRRNGRMGFIDGAPGKIAAGGGGGGRERTNGHTTKNIK